MPNTVYKVVSCNDDGYKSAMVCNSRSSIDYAIDKESTSQYGIYCFQTLKDAIIFMKKYLSNQKLEILECEYKGELQTENVYIIPLYSLYVVQDELQMTLEEALELTLRDNKLLSRRCIFHERAPRGTVLAKSITPKKVVGDYNYYAD